jgi:hypothetical protein
LSRILGGSSSAFAAFEGAGLEESDEFACLSDYGDGTDAVSFH